jgi:SAM-dependent methyltransferase
MGEQDQVRQAVSDSYARAVTSEDGCCCGSPVQKGVAAKLAGYTREELESLPPEAVTNSFGCGNPLAFAEVQEGQTVLDLGSGAGIDVLLAAKIVGPTGRVIGVDMTDEMIAKARENAAAAGLNNVDVRKGIIEKLPLENNSIDWVISNCVINLSPYKHEVFAEIARVLKPGGHMHVSDIVATGLPDWVRRDKPTGSAGTRRFTVRASRGRSARRNTWPAWRLPAWRTPTSASDSFMMSSSFPVSSSPSCPRTRRPSARRAAAVATLPAAPPPAVHSRR